MRPAAVMIGTLLAGPVGAQVVDPEPGRIAIDQWIALVADGAAERALEQASRYFQARIDPRDWSDWVRAHGGTLKQSPPRKVIELTAGRDQPPLKPLEWVRVVTERARPRGGKILERAVAIQEGGRWRVADYIAWPDPAAMVTSLFLPPIPYAVSYAGYLANPGDYLSNFQGRFPTRPRPAPAPPPPPRPTAIANPRSVPRSPPNPG